jgi:hypothetical protein
VPQLIALLTTAALLLSVQPAHGDGAAIGGRAVLRVRVALPQPLTAAAPVVIVSAVDAPQQARTVVLARARLATFDGLAPGEYEITVTVPGGATASARVAVDAMEIVTMAATIASGGNGSSQLVISDRHHIGEGAFLEQRFLRDLPSTSHLSALVETVAPFVVVDHMDNGGLALARSAFMGSRGASWTSTRVVFGDQRAADTGRLGLMPIPPDLDAADSAAVTHGLAPVDIGTPGTHVLLTPGLPGPTRHAAVRASFTTPDMVGTNSLPHAPSIARLESWRDAGVVIGGPVSPDVGVVVSASIARVRQQERERGPGVTAATTGLFGRGVLRPTPRDQVRLSAGGRRLSRPFDGRAQFADEHVDERARMWQAGARWERILDDGARVAVLGDVERQTFTPDVVSAAGGVVDRVFDGIVPEPAAEIRASQWTLSAEFQPVTMRWRDTHHGLRAGLTLRRSRATSGLLALPAVGETVAGRAARVWVPVAPAEDSVRAATHTTLFMDDRIDLAPSFTVTAGLRLEVASGSARGAARGVVWRTASPRVSFRWRLGPLAAFGGYGRYADDLPLFVLAYGDPGAPFMRVHRWTDPDGDGRVDPDEPGVLVARAGAGAPIASIDAGLRAPRTREWTAGGELPIGRHHHLRGTIAIRHQTSLLGTINTGVSPSDYREVFIPDANADWHSPDDDRLLPVYDRRPESFGRDEFLLTNPERAAAKYEGIEIVWDFRSERWRMLFGATAYRAEGFGAHPGFGVFENDQGVIGQQYASPNAAAAVPGRLVFDRAYVGKWSGSYHAPGDVRVAFVARYQDGQPFSRIVVADLSTGPEVIQAYAPGRTRFTYTATVDTRVEKGFRVGRARAAVQLDVFNLTNHRNEVEEDVLTRPTFRLSTAVQPPRTLRLGFRVEF